MDIYSQSIRDLSAADKFRLVEQIWDDLFTSDQPLPLSNWVQEESARRRTQMLTDPEICSGNDSDFT